MVGDAKKPFKSKVSLGESYSNLSIGLNNSNVLLPKATLNDCCDNLKDYGESMSALCCDVRDLYGVPGGTSLPKPKASADGFDPDCCMIAHADEKCCKAGLKVILDKYVPGWDAED